MRHFILLFLAPLFFVFSCTTVKPLNSWSTKDQKTPKNIVFMIVDGMGFEHVKAARIYNGQKPLAFESFTCSTRVTTCPFEGTDRQGQCRAGSEEVTDSAASATALATGIKVSNTVISRALPRSSHDIETILEFLGRQGKSTGVVVTSLITDATPAAFISHANDRDLTEEILSGIFQKSLPTLIFGADTLYHRQMAKHAKAAYEMVHTKSGLKTATEKIVNGPECRGVMCPRIYGGFGQYDMIPGVYRNLAGFPIEITPKEKFVELDIPHLSEMTESALKILSKNQEGFFLMVESSMPDMISHYNAQFEQTSGAPKAIAALISEMGEVEKTIKILENFVAKNPDTLVVLTADHETGGLVIDQDKTACLGEKNCIPEVRWTSKRYVDQYDSASKHTGADVPLYAIGKGSERYCGERLNNIDVPNLALGR